MVLGRVTPYHLCSLFCALNKAATIRNCLNISGVLIKGKEFKISLFADDVLRTLTNPHISLPNLIWIVLGSYLDKN